ncbi:MAG: hypothetical protein KGY55_02935, partial [Candidatus Thermoplasmatota archaeon]|nr:hypothetical protein [Candidatus Thermoplasmatota archaeon]
SGITDGTRQNIRSLSLFELELTGSQLNDGDYFNASMEAAYINVTVSSHASGFLQLNLRVANMSASPVYDRAVAWIADDANYSMNLLDDRYRFSTYIQPYLSTPYNLSFDAKNANGGAFVIRGSRYNGDIGDITMAMGTIEYSSENAYFVDQTYVYEGGAVILNQSQGQAVISAPSFSIQNTTTDGSAMHMCTLGLVDVTGLAGKTSVSGYGTYSIKTNYSAMQENAYIASVLYVNITTGHTAAWQRYMNNTLIRSGIPSTSFNVTSEDNVVTVALYGPSAGSSYDVMLTTSQTDIVGQVGPGWVS